MTIVFDTECNGMQNEEICQLAMIYVDNGEIRGVNHYFSVDTMSEYALRVHGLSKMFLHNASEGNYFSDWAVDNSVEFLIPGALYVGHNVSQDMRIMRKNFKRCGVRMGNEKTFCTMRYFTPMLKLCGKTGQLKQASLSELCEHYRITANDIRSLCEQAFGQYGLFAHDARYDAAATLAVVQRAQRRGDVKGVITIE